LTELRASRALAGSGWNLWRGLVGVGYLTAAAFNLLYTLPAGDLHWFAEMAWSPLLADLVREVVQPNHQPFLLLVVAFELAVAALILSRGRWVDLGVCASVLWVLFLIPFLQPFPMAATNVGLALVQGILLLRRYDTTIWGMVLGLLGISKLNRGGPPS
jgi:hypothetical protein